MPTASIREPDQCLRQRHKMRTAPWTCLEFADSFALVVPNAILRLLDVDRTSTNMGSLLSRVYTAFSPPTVEKEPDAIRFGILGAARTA